MPTALRKVTGNRSRTPLNENEPQPTLGDQPPAPPHYLDEDAAAEWNRLARQLWLNGILGLEDHSVFAGYCESFSDWMRYNRMIQAQERKARQEARALEAFDGSSVLLEEFDGRIVGTSNGNLIQSPIIGLRNTARRDCLKFAAELGLTPSSRTKVNVPRGANLTAAPPAKGAPAKTKRPVDFLNRGPRLAVDNV